MEKHIGDRLAQVMQEQRVSKPELAKRFDVRLQSVYDWVNHGRIAKKHLPRMIEIFNKPLEWWLGQPTAESSTHGEASNTSQPPSVTDSLRVLAAALSKADGLTREQTAPLFAALLQNPANVENIAERLIATLATSSKSRPPVETNDFAPKPITHADQLLTNSLQPHKTAAAIR
jgi:hypothetical protein